MQLAEPRVAAEGQSFPLGMCGSAGVPEQSTKRSPKEPAPEAFSDGPGSSGWELLFVGVGSRVLTQNKSQNRGPDLLKVWAKAINAVSNMGVPALSKHPPEAANWRLLTAPAGKSPPGPARRTHRPKSLPALMAPTVWGRTGPPPVGQAAQPSAAPAIQASWQHRPFRNPIFPLAQQ